MKTSDLFTPLSDRVSKTEYGKQNRVAWGLGIIVPIVVYSFLGQAVTLILAYIIGTGQYGTAMSDIFQKHSLLIAAIIRMLAVTIAVLPLIFSFKLEYPILLPKKEKAANRVVVVSVLGMALALFLNSLAIMINFSTSSQSFNNTSSNQFSLPILWGILVYGIVTPITEEIVHRGIVYNRLRREVNAPIASLICSLLFGLSHGNYVQLVYGFCMGMVICYIYERFGAFVYTVIFHCIANGAVYVCLSIETVREHVVSLHGLAVEAIVVLICVVHLLMLKKDTV